MRALLLERDLPRFASARLATALGASGPRRCPLKLVDIDEVPLPGPEWVRLTPLLSGICGSDLATVTGHSSRWFEPIVSLPFVPGHEIVALTADGARVVVEPVLGCAARGIQPACEACSDGRLGNCTNLTGGCLEPGLQSGFCCDTGGGWSTGMVAHPSQVHDVPSEMDDAAAVMIEPTACALHAALAGGIDRSHTVALVGAGTLGLLTAAALTRWSPPKALVVVAKHTHQRRRIADITSSLTDVTFCEPGGLARAVRRQVGTAIVDPSGAHERLTRGADVTIDCVGSPDSIASALAVTRPGGRVLMVGMPGVATIDLTPLWQREISLSGTYTYGVETLMGERYRSFDLAFELVAAADLGSLVSAVYPLERHVDALEHATNAGPRGATKIVFAPSSADVRVDHPAARTSRGRR